jgi:hypothetical protein
MSIEISCEEVIDFINSGCSLKSFKVYKTNITELSQLHEVMSGVSVEKKIKPPMATENDFIDEAFNFTSADDKRFGGALTGVLYAGRKLIASNGCMGVIFEAKKDGVIDYAGSRIIPHLERVNCLNDSEANFPDMESVLADYPLITAKFILEDSYRLIGKLNGILRIQKVLENCENGRLEKWRWKNSLHVSFGGIAFDVKMLLQIILSAARERCPINFELRISRYCQSTKNKAVANSDLLIVSTQNNKVKQDYFLMRVVSDTALNIESFLKC